MDRNRVIVRTSIIGILANVLLAGFKAMVGLITNSIAVILDAVNNLSDALSSVITIIGAKLSSKKPDKKHPLGYGRIEYISSMIVSAIVLYAGVTSFVESVKKIISPVKADYSVTSLIIISAAVVVKLILGSYVKNKGKSVNSGSLIASGSDAFFDAILSISVLVSAIIYILTDISLEAYVGVIISIIIIKSGVDMLLETVDEVLGKRMDRDLVHDIKKSICEEDEVSGAYDLILHSYGPEKLVGSVHIEVKDTMSADEIDLLERKISDKIYQEFGVIITGIGIYSVNTVDDEIKKLRTDINRLVLDRDGVLQTHGFYINKEKKIINLDIIFDYLVEDREKLFEQIKSELQNKYPDYQFNLTLDIDV